MRFAGRPVQTHNSLPRSSSKLLWTKEHTDTTRPHQVLVNFHADRQTFKFWPRTAQEFQFQFLFSTTTTDLKISQSVEVFVACEKTKDLWYFPGNFSGAIGHGKKCLALERPGCSDDGQKM